MTKADFLDKLKALISEYPVEETSKSLDYYSEMIDDRVEDGINEEDAVASLGDIDEIAKLIKSELPLKTIVKQKSKEKQLPAWAVVLLILGFPVWFPLFIAAGSVIFSLIVALWSIVFSFWVVDLALIICFFAGLFAMVVMLMQGSILSAIIYLGVSLIVLGISIFGFIGCKYMSKASLSLMGWIFKKIKKGLVG